MGGGLKERAKSKVKLVAERPSNACENDGAVELTCGSSAETCRRKSIARISYFVVLQSTIIPLRHGSAQVGGNSGVGR